VKNMANIQFGPAVVFRSLLFQSRKFSRRRLPRKHHTDPKGGRTPRPVFFPHCQLVLRFPSLNVHCSLYHSKYATIFCSMFFFEVALIILLCHVFTFPYRTDESPPRGGKAALRSASPLDLTTVVLELCKGVWLSNSSVFFFLCTHQNIFPCFF